MSDGIAGAESLISAGEIADMAGVSPSAVSNWRRRHKDDFPSPAQQTPTGDLFDREEVVGWLQAHGKGSAGATTQPSPSKNIDEAWKALSNRMRSWGQLTQGRILTWLQLLYFRFCIDVGRDPTGGGMTRVWDEITQDSEHGRKLWERLIAEHQSELGSDLVRALTPVSRVPSVDLAATEWIDAFTGLGEPGRRAFYSSFADLLVDLQVQSRDAADYVTTRAVAGLAAELLYPVEGVLYDPAVGLGTMLTAAWEMRENLDVQVCGQELSLFGWQVAYLRLLLHGADPDLRTGDTILDDQFPGLRADRVVIDPPWVGKGAVGQLPPDVRWDFERTPKNSEWLWVYHLTHHLSAQGRGVILVPPRLAQGSADDRYHRLQILESDELDAVIDLPPGVSPRSSIAPTLLLFDRDRAARRGRVLFIDARTLGSTHKHGFRNLDAEQVVRVTSAVNDWREGTFEPEARFADSATLDEIREADAVWMPARFIRYVARTTKIGGERLEKRLERLVGETGPGLPEATVTRVRDLLRLAGALTAGHGRPWKASRLGDLLTAAPRAGSRHDPEGDGKRVPFIETEAVDNTGRPIRDKPKKVTRGRVGSRTTEPGDVLLTSRGVDEERAPRAAVIECEEPLAYSESLMRLRPDRQLVDPHYLRLFLTSHEGHMALAAVASGTTISNLRADAIEHIEIPLPDLNTQRQIAEAARTAEAAVEELDAFADRMRAVSETLHEGLISGVFLTGSEVSDE